MSNVSEAPDLYISFEDDGEDPTYALADFCAIVASTETEGNPCRSKKAVSAPLIPTDLEEITQFADVLGWEVTFDEDGRVCLKTDIFNPALQERDV